MDTAGRKGSPKAVFEFSVTVKPMENGSKNKIKLMIADNVFTLVSSEGEGYSRHLAAKIDGNLTGVDDIARAFFAD